MNLLAGQGPGADRSAAGAGRIPGQAHGRLEVGGWRGDLLHALGVGGFAEGGGWARGRDAGGVTDRVGLGDGDGGGGGDGVGLGAHAEEREERELGVELGRRGHPVDPPLEEGLRGLVGG